MFGSVCPSYTVVSFHTLLGRLLRWSANKVWLQSILFGATRLSWTIIRNCPQQTACFAKRMQNSTFQAMRFHNLLILSCCLQVELMNLSKFLFNYQPIASQSRGCSALGSICLPVWPLAAEPWSLRSRRVISSLIHVCLAVRKCTTRGRKIRTSFAKKMIKICPVVFFLA